MGALTDLFDKDCSRYAYNLATAIERQEIDYFETFPGEVTEEEIIDYLKEHQYNPFLQRNADIVGPEAFRKLQQLLGKADPPRYFYLSEWHFKKHKNAAMQIISRCQKFDLEFSWRISTENDFFMFHPIKPGIGLEIKNTPMYTPYRLNQIFGKIVTDAGPMSFRW